MGASRIAASRIDIQAFPTNTSRVWIGTHAVSGSARRGIAITAGQIFTWVGPVDLRDIYVDAEVAGEGVSYFAQ